MNNKNDVKRIQTIVIGGGQGGLSVGYYLAKRGLPFLIIDASERIGDTWRKRWDSLRLFTVARYCGLPGMRFPAPGDSFPTKEEMADYLESYAEHFHLPLMSGVRVDKLSRDGGDFLITAGKLRFHCEQVVVAMSNHQKPRIPSFAAELDPAITQIHSHEYRNPSQLQKGGVLIVGVGNSGADIAMDVVSNHRTWLAGKESGHVPVRIETAFGRYVWSRFFRFVAHHILTVDSPVGRKLRPKLLGAAPLVRVKPKDLEDAGIQRVPKVVGVRNKRPLLADDHTIDVANVIWCTGYHAGFSWIDLPILDGEGMPLHDRGIASNEPGIYFVGLHFLYSLTSDTLMGMGRDAERIVKAIHLRTLRTPRRTLSLNREVQSESVHS